MLVIVCLLCLYFLITNQLLFLPFNRVVLSMLLTALSCRLLANSLDWLLRIVALTSPSCTSLDLDWCSRPACWWLQYASSSRMYWENFGKIGQCGFFPVVHDWKYKCYIYIWFFLHRCFKCYRLRTLNSYQYIHTILQGPFDVKKCIWHHLPSGGTWCGTLVPLCLVEQYVTWTVMDPQPKENSQETGYWTYTWTWPNSETKKWVIWYLE